MDTATNAIYVANGLNSSASVISGRTNTVTATIPVGAAPLGVAADGEDKVIYVVNHAGTVSVISPQTNKVTATIGVGNLPVGVAADPETNAAYVANIQSDRCQYSAPAAAMATKMAHSATQPPLPDEPR